jgi:hypothetical protein
VGIDTDNFVDALGSDGGILWQENVSPHSGGGANPVLPLYATSDGGVIVTSSVPACPGGNIVYAFSDGSPECQPTDAFPTPSLGTLYKLDKNGNTISQTSDTGAVFSWTNNWYADPDGTIFNFSFLPVYLTHSWAAVQGGNQSQTLASVENPQLAPLSPSANKAASDALNSLRMLLSTSCPACKSSVFDILHGDQVPFYHYLLQTPRFYDGTQSHVRLGILCGNAGGFWGIANYALCGGPHLSDQCKTAGARTLSEFFKCSAPIAISQTPTDHDKGMLTFFDPLAIYLSAPATPAGIANQALIFHEALHGKYGLQDSDLLEDFGYHPSTDYPSCKITDYLELHIWAGTIETCR